MAKTSSKKTKVVEKRLEDILFDCRNKLREKAESWQNRDAVMSLVFLKFAGDKFEARRKEVIAEYPDMPPELTDKPSFYLSKGVFYLKEHCRWSYIVENAADDKINNILDEAMDEIERDNIETLRGALPHGFFASLGAETRIIKSLIDTVNEISEERFQEKDLIGRVYEYFMQAFAMEVRAGKGEFYTPRSIVELIAELIEPYHGKIYDPCCGSGGMFVQSVKFVEAHNGNRLDVSIYGQESKDITYRLAKMNLAIRGISCNLGERAVSSFTDDQHKDLKVDFIMANPPFNLKEWRGEDQLTTDGRWTGYGLPSTSNANYAWILHMLSKLDVNHGVAGFLLANGALGAGDIEGEIRKNLIENDKIEAIIVLPREMFYSTDISVTLWILNNDKHAGERNGRKFRERAHEVLFIDLRTWTSEIIEKKYVVFSERQIAAVKKIFSAWQTDGGGYKDIPELCRSVKIDEIRDNAYSLAPSKYIEFIDRDMGIDYAAEMGHIQTEMREIVASEAQSLDMLMKAFEGIGYAVK